MSVMWGPYRAKVARVVDGDTLALEVDLGFSLKVFMACRLFGVNAPELRFPEGKVARDWVLAILPAGSEVLVVSHGWDKYGGRFDGTVTLPTGEDLASRMVAEGQAVIYP